MTAIAVFLFLCAAVLIIVGGLSWTGRLPGNSYIGIRVPEVRKSRELWNTAHRVAGPLWTLAGVVLGFGGLLALSAGGWSWLLVVAAVVACLVFLGMGAGMGAHTVALIDAQRTAESSTGCCSSAPAGSDASEKDPAADCGVSGGCGSCSLQGACEGGSEAFAAEVKSVDLEAVRQAADKANTKGDEAHRK